MVLVPSLSFSLYSSRRAILQFTIRLNISSTFIAKGSADKYVTDLSRGPQSTPYKLHIVPKRMSATDQEPKLLHFEISKIHLNYNYIACAIFDRDSTKTNSHIYFVIQFFNWTLETF